MLRFESTCINFGLNGFLAAGEAAALRSISELLVLVGTDIEGLPISHSKWEKSTPVGNRRICKHNRFAKAQLKEETTIGESITLILSITFTYCNTLK